MTTPTSRAAVRPRSARHRGLPVPILLAAVAIAGLCLPAPARALNHAGNLTVSETWLAADNPHVLTGTLSVMAGVTLTLEPGVQVRLPSGRIMYVYGNLSAVGTAGQPITFTRDGASGWHSIQFATNGTGTLTRCNLDNATYGVYQNGTGVVELNGCTISQCTYGMYLASGVTRVGSTTISACTSYGIYGYGAAPVLTDGSVVIDNCSSGLYLSGVSGVSLTMPLTIRNNTTVGLSMLNCPNPAVSGLVATGNTGSVGAQHYENCGDIALGAGTSGGAGALANLWGVSLGPGSYLAAGSVVPASGNTNNDIRLGGNSTSTHGGTLRKFGTQAYAVDGSYSVSAGTTMAIEAGTTIRLGVSRSLIVQGTLQAVGAPGNEIQFVRLAGSNWNSLQFSGGGGGTLSYCHLEYAVYGLYPTGTGTVTASHCTIDHGGYGIYLSSGVLQLGSTVVTNCTSYGLYASVAPVLTDANVVFDNCSTGFYLNGATAVNLTAGLTVRNNATAGLHLANCPDPVLDNLVLTGNTGSLGAQHYDNCGEVSLGAGCTVGGAGPLANLWGVSLAAGSFLTAGSTVPLAGNTNNDIRLGGNSASTHSGTLRKFGSLAYVVDGSYTVGAGTTLTIAPGNVVKLGNSRSLGVQGTLQALGSVGNEIQFVRQGAANWNAIQFSGSGSGALDRCHMEYATYGLNLSGSGTVTVSNSTIDHNTYGAYVSSGTLQVGGTTVSACTSYGLYCLTAPVLTDANVVVDNCATGVYLSAIAGLNLTAGLTLRNNTIAGLQVLNCPNPVVDNLVLTGNTGSLGAQHYENCGDVTLGPGSTVGGAGPLANLWGVSLGAGSYLTAGSAVPTAGNTNNDLRLGGGTGTRSGTLRKFGSLAYVVDGSYTVGAGATLTLAAGNTVKLDNSRTLSVQGTLQAIGAAGAEILFTRWTASSWGSLQFNSGGKGTLERCHIEYATYGLNCSSTDTVRVRESEFSLNLYGVYGQSGTAVFDHARIVNNTGYGLYLTGMRAVFGGDFTHWNDIYGNGSGQAGRDLRNGSTDLTANWVYWGSTRWLLMMAQIWDKHDEAALGEVFFEPYSNSFHNDDLTGVPGDGTVPALPTAFEVAQNRPNPFNPATVIGFALPRAATVTLAVYDVAGDRVATLVDGPCAAGRHTVTWRGTDDGGRAQASGAYFYRLSTPDGVLTRRMMLVR